MFVPLVSVCERSTYGAVLIVADQYRQISQELEPKKHNTRPWGEVRPGVGLRFPFIREHLFFVAVALLDQ
jgi:hypothetical protein